MSDRHAPALESDACLPVRGVDLDPASRCAHWHTELDIVALRFACCDTYWACTECHAQLADHAALPWPVDRAQPAVRCGGCGSQFNASAYLTTMETIEPCCPVCGAAFNPRCSRHHDIYFAD
ncbi:CHY zinc finger protein [Pseudoclavibacter sp. CFCC 14310]|uniref:CHY zinc finger protein n=1 Tax=Pseudoclavibacter sp. CFCC 14310 TaxID=2615180 RepID=UPI0017885FDE|nr:CHY zinc finger protein [Pseudoclavibacter sp. CFCC 14310]